MRFLTFAPPNSKAALSETEGCWRCSRVHCDPGVLTLHTPLEGRPELASYLLLLCPMSVFFWRSQVISHPELVDATSRDVSATELAGHGSQAATNPLSFSFKETTLGRIDGPKS